MRPTGKRESAGPSLSPDDIESVNATGDSSAAWGSDAIAELLRNLGYPYIALVPGSSYRGLHDSLVNHLGNRRPQMLVCLHEEHAVAIAHGYSKVTDEPMAVALHSNVGLMHGCMAVYDAWCDRAPVLIIGATGPVDAARRRPWIDWIHTSRDQGALVRGFVKWDAQPASVEEALASFVRADRIIRRQPRGPAYVCLDVTLQETALDGAAVLPDLSRFAHDADVTPSSTALETAAHMLEEATHPVLLAGRGSRADASWNSRVRLAERLGARVITDLKTAAVFPTTHALHPNVPGYALSAADLALLRDADVILSLDWLDLGGTLETAFAGTAVSARVISISVDHLSTNAVSYDHFALPIVDLAVPCPPDNALEPLLAVLGEGGTEARLTGRDGLAPAHHPDAPRKLDIVALARATGELMERRPVSILRLPLGWPAEFTPFESPLDYLGFDGGAGVGSGPGMVVGMALALRDTPRLPVAVLGDGDLLMGASALWTAAHYRVPLLVLVANNRSYFNDELHQERIARVRGRSAENRWIGQRLDDPSVNVSALAASLGLRTFPTVQRLEELGHTLACAAELVESGEPCLVDVQIEPGYAVPAAAETEPRDTGTRRPA